MAAGTASRFVPLSQEYPKGLLCVKGEILIERQIRQLKEAGIEDITIVIGYKAERFTYLKEKFGVTLVMNEDYHQYNNTSSIIRVLDKLHNTYICSSDNYFPNNVFTEHPQESYYSALYAVGRTSEYCLTLDKDDHIIGVSIGGNDAWYMVGHVYFSEEFSQAFRAIFASEYENEETRKGYWEDVYIRAIHQLPKMKIHRYNDHDIEEFDSLDELRAFDSSYFSDTRSSILKKIAHKLHCTEAELFTFTSIKNPHNDLQFTFLKGEESYLYKGATGEIVKQ